MDNDEKQLSIDISEIESELKQTNIDKIKSDESATKNQWDTLNEKNDNKELSENDIRINILQSSVENANQIYQSMKAEEAKKSKSRSLCLFLFLFILGLSVVSTFVLVFLDCFNVIQLDIQVLITISTYIIANIFAILVTFVKYINNNQYLEMFKTVTHKLLDYLVADKTCEQIHIDPDSKKDK